MSHRNRLYTDFNERYHDHGEEWRSHLQPRFHPYERRPADQQFVEEIYDTDTSERYYHRLETRRFHHPEHQQDRFRHPEQYHPDFHHSERNHPQLPREHHPDFHHLERNHPDFHYPEQHYQDFSHPNDLHRQRFKLPHHQQQLHKQCRDLNLERKHVFDDLHRLEQRVQTLRMSEGTVNQNFIHGPRLNSIQDGPKSHPPRVEDDQKQFLKPHPAAQMVLVCATQIAPRLGPQIRQSHAVKPHAPRQHVPSQSKSFPEHPSRDLKNKPNVVDTGNLDSKVLTQEKTNVSKVLTQEKTNVNETPKNILKLSSYAHSQNSLKQDPELDIDKSIVQSIIQTSSTAPDSETLDCISDENITVAKGTSKQANCKDFLQPVNKLSQYEGLHQKSTHSSAQEAESSIILLNRNFEPIKSVISPRQSTNSSMSRSTARRFSNLQSCKSSGGQDVKDTMSPRMKVLKSNKNDNASTSIKGNQEQEPVKSFTPLMQIQVITSRFSNPSSIPKTNKIDSKTNLSLTSDNISSNSNTITSLPAETIYSYPSPALPIKPAASPIKPAASPIQPDATPIQSAAAPNQQAASSFKPVRKIEEHFGFETNPTSGNHSIISTQGPCNTNANDSISPKFSCSMKLQSQSVQQPTKPLKDILLDIGLDIKPFEIKQPRNETECTNITLRSSNEKEGSCKRDKKKTNYSGKISEVPNLDAVKKTQISTLELKSIIEKVQDIKVIDGGLPSKTTNDDKTKDTNFVGENSAFMDLFPINELQKIMKMTEKGEKPEQKSIQYEDYDARKYGSNAYEKESIDIKLLPQRTEKTIDDLISYSDESEIEEDDSMSEKRRSKSKNILSKRYNSESMHNSCKRTSPGEKSQNKGTFNNQNRYDINSERFLEDQQKDRSTISSGYNGYINFRKKDERRFSKWDDSGEKSLSRKDSSERKDSDEVRFSRWDDSSQRSHARKNSSERKDSDEGRFSRCDDSSQKSNVRKNSSERKESDDGRFSRWDESSQRSHARKNSSERRDLDEGRFSRWDDSSQKSNARKNSSERKDSDEVRFSRWDDSSQRSHSRKSSSEKRDSDEGRFSRWDDSSQRSHARKNSSERTDSDKGRFFRWDDSSQRSHARKNPSERKASDERRFSRWDDSSQRSHARKNSSERKDSEKRRFSKWDDSSEKSPSRKDSSEKRDSDERRFSRRDDSNDKSFAGRDSNPKKDDRRFSIKSDYYYRRSPRRDNSRNSIDTNFVCRSEQLNDSNTYSTAFKDQKKPSTARSQTVSYSTKSPLKSISAKSSSVESSTKLSPAKSPTKCPSSKCLTKCTAKSRTKSSSNVSLVDNLTRSSIHSPTKTISIHKSNTCSGSKNSSSPFSFSKYSSNKKGLSRRRNMYERKHFDLRLKIPIYVNELNRDYQKVPTTNVPPRRELVTYGDMDQYGRDPEMVDGEPFRNTFSGATKHTNIDCKSPYSTGLSVEEGEVKDVNFRKGLEKMKETPETPTVSESFSADIDYRKSPEITKRSDNYLPIRDQRLNEVVDFRTEIFPRGYSEPNEGISITQEPIDETEQPILSKSDSADTAKIPKDGQELKSKPEKIPAMEGHELSSKQTSVADETCVTIENSLSKISLKNTEGNSVTALKETETLMDSTQNTLKPREEFRLKSQNKFAKKPRWNIKVESMKPTSKREEMLRKDQLRKAVSAMAADPSMIENLAEEASDHFSESTQAKEAIIVEEAVTRDPDTHVVKAAIAIAPEVHPEETAFKIAPEKEVSITSSNLVFEGYPTKRIAEAENNVVSASLIESKSEFNPDLPYDATTHATKSSATTHTPIELTYSSHPEGKSSQPTATSCSDKGTNDLILCSTSENNQTKKTEKEKHEHKKCFASKHISNSKKRHSSENNKKKYSSKQSSGVEMFSKYEYTKSGLPKPPISFSPSGISIDPSKSFKGKRRHKSSGQLRMHSENANVLSTIKPILIDSSSASETEGKGSQTNTPQVQAVQKDENKVIYVSSSESDVQYISPSKTQGKKKVHSTSVTTLGAKGTSSVSVSIVHEEVTIDKELVILVEDINPTKTKDALINKVLENDAEKNETRDLAPNKPDQPKKHKLKLKIPKKSGNQKCKEDLSEDKSAFGSFLEQQSNEYLKKRIKPNKSPKRLPIKPLSLPSTPDKHVMEYPTVKPPVDRSISCDDYTQFKTPDKPKVSSDSLLLRESILSGFKKNLEKSPILKAKLKSSSPANEKSQKVHWNLGESSKTAVPVDSSSIEEPMINEDICQSNNAVEDVMMSSFEPAHLKSADSIHSKTDEINDDFIVTPLPDDHSNSDESEAGSLDLGEDDDVDLEQEISLLGYNDDIPSKMSTVTSRIETVQENIEMSISFTSSKTTEAGQESTISQQSFKPSNTGFSLDDLLAEKDTEVRNQDLLQMQDELKEDIKKGGFKVLQEEALADSCNDLLPEQERELEKLQVSDSVIKELHPGETVFHSELFLRVFNELLKPSHCGFTPGGSLIDQQLSNVQSDLLADFLASGILTMCFHRINKPESICRWLFYIMSIHRSSLVVHSCQILLMDIIQTQQHTDNISITWSPSPLDILKIFVNYGVKTEEFIPTDNCYSPEEISAIIVPTLEDGVDNNNNHNSLYLISRDNLLSILDTLSCALQARPDLKTDELTFIVEILVKAAIDKSLNNNKCHYEFQVVVSSVLECYDKDAWLNMVPELCDRLSKISSHHHNRVYIVQLLPPGSRGHYLQQRLAAVLLHEEMTAHSLTQCPEKIQIKSLFMYVDYMKKLIKKVELYKLCSCIMLMDLAVGNETIATSEKVYLSKLSEMINVLKGDLRDSVQMLDKTRVKDLMVRISSKWTLMISTMGCTQRNLFSWTVQKSPQKMRVETLETQSDQDSDGSDSETENQSKDSTKVIDSWPKMNNIQMENDMETPSGSNSQNACRNILESDNDYTLLSSDDDLPEL